MEELDDEQRTAVFHEGGSLLVKAGPGSGKTLVIAERVENLVANGIPQKSILCMTFTEKATDEMRRRLLERNAGNVQVSTMHALCLEMLKEHGMTTGITEKTRVFGELAEIAWCFRNAEDIGFDPDIVKSSSGAVETYKKIMNTVRMAKREMITVDVLEKRASEKVRDATTDVKRKEGAMLVEVAKAYRAYEEYKKKRDLVDYEDMVSMTVDFLMNDEAAQEEYRNKYAHVLVDEFQDNNYAQFELAKLLASGGSITAVGDDNQSIMGFQGAFDGIFAEFEKEYGDGVIDLKANYRCLGNIRKISAKILGADPSREVKSLRGRDEDGEKVDVVVASDGAAERDYVVKTISESGPPYGDVAVLCTTNQSCQKFAETLRGRGIPVAVAGIGGTAFNPSVAQTMALLHVADSPETSGKHVGYVLKARGIREYNIKAINAEASRRRAENDVFSVIQDYTGSDQDVEIHEIGRMLRELTDEAKTASLPMLLHAIMGKYSDIYKRYSDGRAQEGEFAHLKKIHDMAEDYLYHYRGERLSDFVDYVDLAAAVTVSERIDDDAEASDAVKVMTIHKSKGKEFETVFVTGLHDGNMPGRRRSTVFEIPRDLLQGKGRARNPTEAHGREKLNMLYVAMTRAKEKLHLTFPKTTGNRKEEKPSRFLEESGCLDDPCVRTAEYSVETLPVPPPQDKLDAEKIRLQKEACMAVNESRPEGAAKLVMHLARISHVQKHGTQDGFDPQPILDACGQAGPPIPMPKAKLVNRETLKLSASKIDTYRECPLKFKYENVLGFPQDHSIHMKKGNAVHTALQSAGNAKLRGQTPDIDYMVDVARGELETSRTLFSKREYEEAEASLAGVIEKYVSWEAKSQNEIVGVEVDFDLLIDGIRYTGRMDRVERNPSGQYEIVDFKTGKNPVSYTDAEKSPQLNIYAKAVKEKYHSLPAKAAFLYLEKNNAMRPCPVTSESLEANLKGIEETAKSIVDEKFDATPDEHCKRCPYKSFCPDAKR